ncbi:MAG: penicillin-binding transpeptidase domain-containing protein [Candidatus Babeliales bacterium]|nr:penicillin-binding transpeptidase domain-containing protein [Candidatus Babeliales bacterium]
MNNVNDINNKLVFVFKIILILLLIIFVRLFYLQISLNDKLSLLGKRNFTRIAKVASPRGNITDYNGHLLATNRQVINIYWRGTGNKQFDPEQLELINNLQTITHSEFTPEDLIKIKVTERYSRNSLLFKDIPFEKLSQILEKLSASPNLEIETKFQRYYTHKSLASHVIGYLSQIDEETIGKMGLEKILEDNLKGQPGQTQTTINSLGKNLKKEQILIPECGKTIRTTLDLHLQKIAEEIFPPDYKGSLILMDPRTGSIRALLSRPNFDSGLFLKKLSLQDWQDFQETQPFLNRAFNACYPPASIFKLVTVTAALDSGLIKRESNWNCRGFITYCGRKYHCNKLEGHGLLTTVNAVGLSCNPFFYEIAKHLEIDTLADYANRFGLGQKTGVIFSEEEGLIPTSKWKRKTLKEKWWRGETLSAVIGQSYLLVTPIQIARMISGIFEGYLIKPRILEDQPIEKSILNIRPDVLQFLREAMRISATIGTAQRAGRIRDIMVYGKTGTAQTISFETQGDSMEKSEHAWFGSNIAYKDEPSLTLIILIEKAGHSRIATEVAKQFLLRYKKLMVDLEKASRPL